MDSRSGPGPVTVLRPVRLKTAALVVACLALAFTGLWNRAASPLLGWLWFLFFGFCALALCARLAPGAAYLELRADGFFVCEWFRRSELIGWQQVSAFELLRFPRRLFSGGVLIVFNDDRPRNARLARMNQSLFGFTSALPNTYGRKPALLLEELNMRRMARICGSGGPAVLNQQS